MKPACLLHCHDLSVYRAPIIRAIAWTLNYTENIQCKFKFISDIEIRTRNTRHTYICAWLGKARKFLSNGRKIAMQQLCITTMIRLRNMSRDDLNPFFPKISNELNHNNVMIIFTYIKTIAVHFTFDWISN